MNQLFEFFSKRFKCKINSESDIKKILKNCENLIIAVRHADTFLKDETIIKRNEIIKLLAKYGIVKLTWKTKESS